MERSKSVNSGGRVDILATAFGTTVAMWAIGYVCRLPPAIVPSWLMALGMLACLPIGGVVAGRYTGRGPAGGAYVGGIASLLNMLILGSLLTGERPNQIVPSALWWIPGTIAASVALGAAGAAVGGFTRRRIPRDVNWMAVLAGDAAAAALLLVVAGGLVTSSDAGLAVVDWPNSFGYNMFLYPLGRMTGGIYYEHAHRLFGSLVGLAILAMAVEVQARERRRSLKAFAWVLLLFVIVQGILGGLRVTGRFTLSTSPADTAPSITLAIVHGVVGQVIFGMIVSMIVFLSTAWRSAARSTPGCFTSTDRFFGAALVILMIVQLVLGAILRHITGGLLIHISMAVIVLVVAHVCGIRACVRPAAPPFVPRLGRILLVLTGIQAALGLAALIAVGLWSAEPRRPATEVVLATAHQGAGAVLLACAVVLMLWAWRLRERGG